MATHTGKNLKSFFDQYLRDTRIPLLEYKIKGRKLQYRYTQIVNGFAMPLKVTINQGETTWITPSGEWQTLKQESNIEMFSIDPNFYIEKNMVE